MHTIHQKINHKTCPFTLLKLFSFVLFLVFSLTSPQKIFAAEQSQWQSQEVESKDVLIWTKTVPNSDFKAFKGQVTIAAPLNKVLAVIKNLQHYPEWYHQNKLTKRLQVINKQQNLN